MRNHFSILRRKWILQNSGSWRTFNEVGNLCPMWAFLCIMILIANKARIVRFSFLFRGLVLAGFSFEKTFLF